MKPLKSLITTLCLLMCLTAFSQEHTILSTFTDSVSTLRKQTAYSVFQTMLLQDELLSTDSVQLRNCENKFVRLDSSYRLCSGNYNECIFTAKSLSAENRAKTKQLKKAQWLNKILVTTTAVLGILVIIK